MFLSTCFSSSWVLRVWRPGAVWGGGGGGGRGPKQGKANLQTKLVFFHADLDVFVMHIVSLFRFRNLGVAKKKNKKQIVVLRVNVQYRDFCFFFFL